MTKSMKWSLLAAVSSSIIAFALAQPATAQDAPASAPTVSDDSDIIITGTRREVSVQDVPVNIAAVSGAQIEEQGASNMTELSSSIAGLHIIDLGGHTSQPIIVRGLNADPVGPNDGVTDAGGTVGQYVGDIPLVIDMRLEDMDRVEVLMGPQGTLYGSGTLGGAIRYIPRKPQFGKQSIEYRTDFYKYSEGKDWSADYGLTFNIPVGSKFALRGSIDHVDDEGFIDYNYIVQDPGVSEPDPDFNNPTEVANNLAPMPDANDEDVLSGRLAARWEITPRWDATLSYYFQNSWVGGRQISSGRGIIPVPEYTSTKRVRETFERDNDLLALEQTLDLGFADLTSSTGYSRLFERTRRDQTDLLLLLNPASPSYYYDNFPTFTAFTHDTVDERTFTQEFRLVSKGDGPLSWLGGVFYSDFDSFGTSKEFTPHFSQYVFDNFGGAAVRSDDLEYFNVGYQDLVEKGVFGEIGYDITDKWNASFGGRWYSYDLKTRSATDFPLLNTAYFGQGPDEIVLDFEPANQADDGFLWKFNTSYDFTDDLKAYFTRSEGFRIGNSNGLTACDGSGTQTVCAGPGEAEFQSDKTVNYEVGLHSQWFGHKLTFNAATYFVQWEGPQVNSATLQGAQPITINGGDAESKGVELNFNAKPIEHFRIRGSYSYNNTEFIEDSPGLITVSNSPNGFEVAGPSVPTSDPACGSGQVLNDPSSVLNGLCIGPLANYRIDGKAGDRLPGSPQHQGSLFMSYEVPLNNGLNIDFTYGVVGVGDILTRTGGRGDSLTLPSYFLHNASAQLSSDKWTMKLYVKNLFDEFVEAGATGTVLNNVILPDLGTRPSHVRSFYSDVLPPRTIGLQLSYKIGE